MADGARRGLGRGLSALLGEADTFPTPGPEAAPPSNPSREAPIELLRRNPDQPRRTFAEAELEELAASIRELGVLQPILVRPVEGASGEFQIVAGERRWRAAQRAGLHAVPVLVRTLSDSEVAEIAVVENVQRTDLNPLEEAQGYRLLLERFGRTQEAKEAGRLSAGHARAIAGAPDPATLARTIVERGLSVRDAESLARQVAERPQTAPRGGKARGVKDADTQALEQDLADALGLQVEILDRDGAGEVRLRYASLEQLDSICQRLSGGRL